MKQLYIRPASMKLSLAPSSMLAASSFAPNDDHKTTEQYSVDKQFDADFEGADEWEWE